jgi:anti-sigma factor RsiW
MDAQALEGGGFSMKHYPASVWTDFVQGKLSQQEQTEAEEHLYGCDECLECYMDSLNPADDLLPTPQELDSFDEQVMNRLLDQSPQPNGVIDPHPSSASLEPAKRRTMLQHPLFHYAVAASITLLLMSSGVFSYVTNQTDEWRNTLTMGGHSSLSEQWTDQATEAISNFQTKLREGPNDAR